MEKAVDIRERGCCSKVTISAIRISLRFRCKPAPDVLQRAIAALGASAEDCIFVGDSAADMEAGRRAGGRICAVDYGYRKAEALRKWEPDYWVSDLRELAAVG